MILVVREPFSTEYEVLRDVDRFSASERPFELVILFRDGTMDRRRLIDFMGFDDSTDIGGIFLEIEEAAQLKI